MSRVHTDTASVNGVAVGGACWVHFDGWAGRRKNPAVLIKISPKRSLIRYTQDTGAQNYSGKAGDEVRVPNYAISARTDESGRSQR